MTRLKLQAARIEIQYSPQIRVRSSAPQEHASGEKKLNCFLSTRTSKCKKFKILSTRSRKKAQTANTHKKFTVVGLISNRQIWNHVYGKQERQNVILISLLFLLRKRQKNLFKQSDFIAKMAERQKAKVRFLLFDVCVNADLNLCVATSCSVWDRQTCMQRW